MKRLFWAGNQVTWWVAMAVIVFSLGARATPTATAWTSYSLFSGIAALASICSVVVFAISGLFAQTRWRPVSCLWAGIGCALASLFLAWVLSLIDPGNAWPGVIKLPLVFLLPPAIAPWISRKEKPAAA